MKKLILLLALTAAFNANSALLFKSSFGPGVTLNAPSSFYGTGAFRTITGTDKNTGFAWPPKIGGGINQAALQIITQGQVTQTTIGKFYEASIRQMPERAYPSIELFWSLNEPGVEGDCCDQIPLVLSGGHKSGDVKELYISYWFRYQPDLAKKLGWRTQFGFKTGGYNNQYGGDYRIETTIINRQGKFIWLTVGDTNANAPIPPKQYWRAENNVVPVPIDKWFKYEVYWKRSTGSDGRFWSAVDGQVIVDRFGANMGTYNLPINRIIIADSYGSGKNPQQSRITGIEMHSTWPCGVGVSCYGK